MKKNFSHQLLISDEHGNIFSHPYLKAVLWNGKEFLPAIVGDMIKMPAASRICMLPDRHPIGFDPVRNSFEIVEKVKIKNSFIKCFAVALIPPPGYTRTFLPAYYQPRKASLLPLYAYTSVCADGGNSFLTALMKTDTRHHWDARFYNTKSLPSKIEKMLSLFPDNRILQQLAYCSTHYSCYTAQNIFYRRWEGGIPVSNICNARCAGCLSKKYISAPAQFRINYIPSVEEIEEIAFYHLNYGKAPAISFGQGCEGEPTLRAELIAEAISRTRKKTKKGLFCLNTNGSRPKAIQSIIEAGLSAVRIALNSASKRTYEAYFKPADFSLSDIENSIKIAKQKGTFTSINLLVFPGITDMPDEAETLLNFLKRTKPDMIQLRNLGIDPQLYLNLFEKHAKSKESPIGIRKLIERLKSLPLQIGNFNPIK